MPQTAPTKSNLNAAKRSRTLASTGYELMDRKRNILIRELMALIDDAKELQARIDATFAEAYASMRMAEISTGGSARLAADSVPIDEGFTRDDHPDLSNQLFASYSEVSSARRDGEQHLPPGLRDKEGAKARQRPQEHRHPRP